MRRFIKTSSLKQLGKSLRSNNLNNINEDILSLDNHEPSDNVRDDDNRDNHSKSPLAVALDRHFSKYRPELLEMVCE